MSDDRYATETEALYECAERELETQRHAFAAKVEHWRDRAEAAERRVADMQVVLNATKARLSVAERIERRARGYRRLIETALHLRQHGEHAPGGNETWAQWDRDAETMLRTDLDRVHAEWDHDDTRRFEHLAAADPEDQ